ncbi:hypothetical protein OAJ57_02215 [Alphaproteobacteria bacterium]|nr:hypothetical protein [Alphaproteobacteria bacterium]
MFSRYICVVSAIAVAACFTPFTVRGATNSDILEIRTEIKAMKKAYEDRIKTLETKLETLEKNEKTTAKTTSSSSGGRSIKDNSFNPSVGVIMNGRVSGFSRSTSEIAGFGPGEEGERGKEGLAVDESELNFSANVDDKFYGSLTAALVREDGSDKVELEEAFIQTLPDLGLPDGARLKVGRAFWTFGYLNEHHSHSDDFADRPLPNRVYLNQNFNDDGVEISYVLPTDFYSEIGGGVFRGDDFPAGGSSSGLGAWSAFARVGGDVGDNQSWRLGGYVLRSDVNSRSTNEDVLTFIGKSNLYATDIRYTWAPTGNSRQQELIAQAELFYRDEDGTYNDSDTGTGTVFSNENSFGWYAQAVYKFTPAWRIGGRYSQLNAPSTPPGLEGSVVDAQGHNPYNIGFMGDWTNSEFGRVRLQYNREKLAKGSADNQFLLQYIMSIGAHGAHAF